MLPSIRGLWFGCLPSGWWQSSLVRVHVVTEGLYKFRVESLVGFRALCLQVPSMTEPCHSAEVFDSSLAREDMAPLLLTAQIGNLPHAHLNFITEVDFSYLGYKSHTLDAEYIFFLWIITHVNASGLFFRCSRYSSRAWCNWLIISGLLRPFSG